MNLTMPAPDEKVDLSTESEQEIVQRARIAAQIAGYKSIRHFTIAAMLAIIKKHPLPGAHEQTQKK